MKILIVLTCFVALFYLNKKMGRSLNKPIGELIRVRKTEDEEK